MHNDADFKLSKGWFEAFKTRYNISFRRATNCCQKTPDDQEGVIRAFHESIRTIAAVTEGDNVTTNTDSSDEGKFFLQNIANMDQTPLPFTLCDGPTYAEKGEKTIWVRGASGLEKRQCTAQITLFADGVPDNKTVDSSTMEAKGCRSGGKKDACFRLPQGAKKRMQ